MDVHQLSKFAVAGTIVLIWRNGNPVKGGHIYSVNFYIHTNMVPQAPTGQSRLAK